VIRGYTAEIRTAQGVISGCIVADRVPLFLRYPMAKRKSKTKLDVKTPTKKPPYVMPEPNDDAAAFGWELKKLRYPAADSPKNDVWPGRSIFQPQISLEEMQAYGHDMAFIEPGYLQRQFDHSPAIRKAAEKASAEKYSPESLARLQRAIQRVFTETVLPEIEAQFDAISKMVAQFYAARLAHIETFGFEDDYGDQIEASTTKSRR